MKVNKQCTFYMQMYTAFIIFIINILKNVFVVINPLTPKDHYSGRTAPLTSKRCILYFYSTNTGT